MNIPHFTDYAKHCEKINIAFRYLPDFNADAVFSAWVEGGLFTSDWKLGGILSRWWINVAAHMSVAAVLGFKIAEVMEAELARENISARDIVEALLIHDWNKHEESRWIEETRDIDRVHEYHQDAKVRLLQWFSEAVVSLIEATGDSGVRITEKRKLTLAEQIVFYTDCCTSGSTIVTYKERFDRLLTHFCPGGRYAHTDAYYKARYGMSHREKHDQILLPIEENFINRSRKAGLRFSRRDFPRNLVPVDFLE